MYRFDEESGKWVTIRAKRKKDPLCQVNFCTRISEKGARTGRSLECTVCRVRIWRANNPIRANYNAIKNKARRRKIPFTLTFEFFTKLCEDTGFHLLRGRLKDAYQIDRIDALRGYSDDNVQILTAADNREKSNWEETCSCDEWERRRAEEGWEENPGVFEPSGDDPF